MPKPRSPWYRDGLRFTCTACGECCRSHGAYTHVYANDADAAAMARALGLTLAGFERRYALRDEQGQREIRFVRGACVFLKGGKCSVYAARPVQCRTFPFWPENLAKTVWEREIARDCPGVGKGKLWTRTEVERIAEESEAGD